MRRARWRGRVGVRLGSWLTLLGLASMVGHAEQYPLKTYTTADGLAHGHVNRIVQDAYGFLWFCTRNGLSRFDGYGFTNYSTAEGLPHANVTDLVQTRDGTYWVATEGGLCHFHPRADPPTRVSPPAGSPGTLPAFRAAADHPFTLFPLQGNGHEPSVTVLLEAQAGGLWCGTQSGLYRIEAVQGRWIGRFVSLSVPEAIFGGRWVTALREDRRGFLWMGTLEGLYRRTPEGTLEHYTTRQGLPDLVIRALLEDRAGRLWVGTDWSLGSIVPEPHPDRPLLAHVYTARAGLAGRIRSLFQSSDGRLWSGTLSQGLLEVHGQAANEAAIFRRYSAAQGLSNDTVEAISEDREGNLWLGTEGGGAMRWARPGFVTYHKADGLAHLRVRALFENRQGEFCVISGPYWLHRFDGTRFIAIHPHGPTRVMGWHQSALEDHTGEWWMPSPQGLFRFPKVGRMEALTHTRPKAIYTTRNGLASDAVALLFEDRHGDLWIGSGYEPGTESIPASAGLTRWARATGTFHHLGPAEGLPLNERSVIRAFAEDRAGQLWIGLGPSGLVRYRDGRFIRLTEEQGLPPADILRLFMDRDGRMWIATTDQGVLCLEDPTCASPRVRRYTIADGLSSHEIYSFTEDRWRRIYIGTARGVDRLDPVTGKVQSYSTAEGLASGAVTTAFRDREENLWFGTPQGLARLVPEASSPEWRPPIRIIQLWINGEPYPVPERGPAAGRPLMLRADQNRIQIEVAGLSLAAGARLRYQYRLEPADASWTAATEERRIRYAHLAPGTYRFAVQAVSAQGLTSPQPAVVAFTIPPPLWRRWWFLALAALSLSAMGYALLRYHVHHKLAVERVRTRIATDLHDGFGSILSQIALLSELVKQQIGEHHPQAVERLTQMGEMARGIVGSMNDFVWSIDPRRDHMGSLVTRLRQEAVTLLEARHIDWALHGPVEGSLEEIGLSAEFRHHVLLIFREALHNIVRHAQATSVIITLTMVRRELAIEVQDNGRGFCVPSDSEIGAGDRPGNGLRNMHSRAAQLRGRLSLKSVPGQGTHLLLKVPLP